MIRTTEGWIEQYVKKGALWIHDGNPQRPHALLTSGKHSNGFFNSRLVINDTGLLWEAAEDLISQFADANALHFPEVIVGPQTGATKLAGLMSLVVTLRTGKHCHFASPAKTGEDGKGPMVFTQEEGVLLGGRYILLCEDVMTTGGSIDRMLEAIYEWGGKVMPLVCMLVNRTDADTIGDRVIISLINRSMPTWEATECPLCKGGSEAIRPKGTENWARLNVPSCQDCGSLMSDKTSHWKCDNCHSVLTKG